MKSPFPWFGGKSRVAVDVWARFGDVPNYVEPFAGSLAVLLGRPHAPKIETVNDLDGYVANFWRAMTKDPEAVAHHADNPVNECDLHARHAWLGHNDSQVRPGSGGDHRAADPRRPVHNDDLAIGLHPQQARILLHPGDQFTVISLGRKKIGMEEETETAL